MSCKIEKNLFFRILIGFTILSLFYYSLLWSINGLLVPWRFNDQVASSGYMQIQKWSTNKNVQ